MKTIGFIGLGTMGKPMAMNLLKKNYHLTVFNRTPGKTGELQRLGAEVVDSPAQVAKTVDVLFTNVSNDQALLDVFFGVEGILAGIHPGLTVIDCSTVSPETSRRIHQEMAVHYADFLDAPVTGSKAGAENGSLVIMVGGDYEIFKEQADLFEILGKKTVYMGPSGSGSTAKLANNLLVAVHTAALAEALAIVAKAGLDPERFLEIVQNGAAASKASEAKGQKMIDHDFSSHFSLALMLKDLGLAAKLSQEFQLPTPLLNDANALFQIGLSKGLGDQDLSVIVQIYEDWMQQPVRKLSSSESTEPSVPSKNNRRTSNRVPMNIQLQIAVYQWEQEGSFSGQTIQGSLSDLSETGLQIISSFPLAMDMFIVIYFPQEADLPPVTGKIIRIEPKTGAFVYGCMLSGIPPYVRIKLEDYIAQIRAAMVQG